MSTSEGDVASAQGAPSDEQSADGGGDRTNATKPVQLSCAAVLEALRQRRDHYHDINKQQESRAQFLGALVIAIVGATWVALADHALLLQTAPAPGGLWLAVAILAAASNVAALCLSLLLFVPLDGRHLFNPSRKVLSRLERWVDKLSFRGRRWRKYRHCRSTDEVVAFTSQVVLRRMKINLESYPTHQRRLLAMELHNTYAQWFVMWRKAGLLRLTIAFMFISAFASAAVYVYAQLLVDQLTPR